GEAILRRLGAELEDLGPSTLQSLFVGRKSELAALDDAFAAAAQKRAVSVLVEGESGVGKSHLARRFTEQLLQRHRETEPFLARCYERESVPFKAVDGIVDGVAKYLAEWSDDAQELLPQRIALLAEAFPVLLPFARRSTPSSLPEAPSPQEQRVRVFH